MGGCVGFIQNLMGPRAKRCVDGAGVGEDVEEDVVEDVGEDWLLGRLQRGKASIDQVPSCSPDCWAGWGPGCSRGGSEGGRSFWRRARPAKSGRLRYVACMRVSVAPASLLSERLTDYLAAS